MLPTYLPTYIPTYLPTYKPRLIYWLLIMATATLTMIAPCASWSKWKCLLSCQVLPFGCMRQTTRTWQRDGNVIVLSLIENNSTLINISLDRMYFYENLLIIVEVKAIWKPWKLGNFTFQSWPFLVLWISDASDNHYYDRVCTHVYIDWEHTYHITVKWMPCFRPMYRPYVTTSRLLLPGKHMILRCISSK